MANLIHQPEFRNYKAKSWVHARCLRQNTSLDTVHGTVKGTAGDYLITDIVTAEMWIVPRSMFEAHFEEV